MCNQWSSIDKEDIEVVTAKMVDFVAEGMVACKSPMRTSTSRN